MPDEYSDLFSTDNAKAQSAAARLADAIRKRRGLGVLGLATGDPAQAAVGHELSGVADKLDTGLLGAAQHRAQQQIEQQRYQEQYGAQAGLGGVSPQVFNAQTTRQLADQGKFSVIHDAFGRPTGALNARTGRMLPLSTGGAPQGPQAPQQPQAPSLQPAQQSSLLPSDAELGFTPKALDQAAEAFAQTGHMPPVRGKIGAAVQTRIRNRAAELHPDLNLATAGAAYHADQGSLASQQKVLDNAEGWERTGKANLGVLLGVAQKLADTGSPWINQPVRRFMDKGVGDPNQAAFRTAHATVVNEYAKILSGSQGSSGVTDSARHEAESMLPLDATWQQLSEAARILDTDAGNRINSARQQVSQIRGRIGSSGQPSAPAAGPAAAPAAPKRKRYNPATSTIEEVP